MAKKSQGQEREALEKCLAPEFGKNLDIGAENGTKNRAASHLQLNAAASSN